MSTEEPVEQVPEEQPVEHEEEETTPKSVTQLLTGTQSYTIRKKVIDDQIVPKLEQQEVANQFISLVLSTNILITCMDQQYRILLADTTEKAIAKSPKSLQLFTTFLNSKHAKVLSYTHARLSFQFCLAHAMLAYLRSDDNDQKLIESSLVSLLKVTTIIYLNDGQGSLYTPFGLDLQKYSRTGSFHAVQAVVRQLQKKNELSFFAQTLSGLASSDSINEFVVASSVFPQLKTQEYAKTLSEVIMKCTQQGVNVAQMDWSLLFKVQLKDTTEAPELVDALEKAFRRSKDRIAPIIAQLFSVLPNYAELVPLVAELLKTREANLQSFGIGIAKSAIEANLKDQAYTAIAQALEGGMDHAGKIRLFKMFTSIKENALEERFATVIQTTLPQRTENDLVRSQIVDTVTLLYLRYQDWTVPSTLIDTYFNILQTASNAPNIVASTTTVSPIESDTEYLKKRIYNSIGDLATKLAGRTDVTASLKKITDLCVQLVTGSEKKFPERPLALYALRALLKLSLVNPPIISTGDLTKNKIYRALSGKDGAYLVNWDTFLRVQFEPDFIALADVVKLALFDHTKNLSLNDTSNEVMTTACRVLANTRSWRARDVLKQAVQTNRAMGDKIFSVGFPAFIKHLEEVERPVVGEEEKDTFVFNTKTTGLAFLALAPVVTADMDLNLLKLELLYAHHPLVLHQLSTKHANSGQIWEGVLLHSKAERVFFDLVVKTDHDLHQPTDALIQITKYVLDVLTNETSNINLHKAASHAVATLAFTTTPHIIPTGNKDHETQHEHNNCVVGQYILRQLSDSLQNNAALLSRFSQEDFSVYEATEGTLYSNLETELARNPIYHSNVAPTSNSPYALTNDEWQRILKREKDIHSKQGKNATETLQDIRKNLVTEQILKKESKVRKEIGEMYRGVDWVLQALLDIVERQQLATHFEIGHPKLEHEHQQYSLVLFRVISLLNSQRPLAVKAFRFYDAVIKYAFNNREATQFQFKKTTPTMLASMVSRATARIMAGKNDDTRVSEDNDIAFGETVIKELRLALSGRVVSHEAFATLLPFLQAVLNRNSVVGPKDQRIQVASLSTAMSIFSAHAGMDNLGANLREIVGSVCVNEVLAYIPHLNKQSYNAMLAMAPHMSEVGFTEAIPRDWTPILEGLVMSGLENVRLACLKTIQEYMRSHAKDEKPDYDIKSKYVHAVFVGQFDDVEEHSTSVNKLWMAIQDKIPNDQLFQLTDNIREYSYPLLQLDGIDSEYTRYTAAAAIAGTFQLLHDKRPEDVEQYNTEVTKTLTKLFSLFGANADTNSGVAATLDALSSSLRTPESVQSVFDFLITRGLRDTNEQVLDAMVGVGLSVVATQGKKYRDLLINQFQTFLNKAPRKTQSDDFLVGSVVVFLGSVAVNFEASDNRLVQVIDRLIETLSVQSNTVQQSVSLGLSPLVAILARNESTKSLIDPLIERIMNNLFKKSGKTYGDRRGQAWGLAGLVKGMGLEGVHPIIQQLASHVTNKNDKKAKESVMLAYECLARRFQRLFEPYIVEVMPNIVFEGWSDSSKDVRQAATDAAQVILKQMTGHAVRMILPNVLSSIRDTGAQSNWRQKQANIRLLGHMAYCAPRQLSSSLQVIVQALSESLNDTHPDVTSAAQKALERIGGAVANPEIAQQVPTLIKALHDPEKFTNEVLEALLYTRFTHSIDAASLALLAPILFRGLRERATHIKRKSAQIIGSMSSLVTNPSDMMPYVPPMVPLLQQILLDPNPQVRASAAKAFGSLSKSIGEDRMGDLIPWLHKRLKTSSSGDTSTVISVERSGAAQALCEIIAAQGVARLEESLPFLLAQISRDNEDFEEEEEEDDEIKGKRDRQSIREGYLQLFIYLPSLMKHDFERFLPLTLPKVLDGLSDNSEIVRETALASCKVIVELFATSTASFEMLLPALRDGLENEEWRVRYYSVMLMSDFLERISQKNTPVSQTSEFDTKINIETLQKVLGESMVDQILSLLFLCMNDSHPYVKSEATLLWRGMVPHTPRTLRAIVSTSLVGLIIQHLNKNEEQRINAARALGELVAKLGDKVLGDVIPQLADQLKSDDVETRIGVCHGLRELMNSASEKHLKQHTKKLLPAVKRAVCDRDESVQEAASLAFDVLYRVIGSKAVSDIITQLMTDLGGDDREVALSGLKQLVRVRPQSVLPKLVPAMLESPITATQAKALTAVCQSLGAGQQQHLSEHLPNIVSSLTNEISTFPEELPTAGPIITDERAPNTGFMFAALSAAMENIEQDDFEDIIELFRMNLTSNIVVIRRSYALTMQVLFQALAKRQTAVDGGSDLLGDEEFLQEEYPLLLEHTLRLYNDPDENVIRAAIGAVTAIITSLKKEVWPNYIDNVRDVIRSLSEDDSGTKVVDRLPGFVEEKGKGMDALLQLFLQGLVYGKSPEVREQAALGLGDMIELTDAKALSPHVLKVTGPLIRIVGDRFPWQVKAAILKTLSLLLDKGGVSLKPFLPQLQTILIKSLQDANVVVRKYAQEALAKLVPLGARPDNLVGELNTGIKTQAFTKQSVTQIELGSNNTTGIVISLLMALNGVMKNEDVGKKLKSTVLDTAVQQLLLFLMITENAGEEESLLAKLKDIGDLIDAASACLATLLRYVPAEQFQTTLGQLLQPSVGVSLQSKLILLSLLLTGRDISRDEAKQARELIRASLKDFASVKADVVPIVTQGLRASANLLWHIIEKGQGDASDLVNEFSTLHATANAQNQLRYELAKVMKYVAKQCHKMGNTEELYPWVKPLASIGVKDRYIPVKLCSERILMYILSGNALKEYMNRWREFVGDEKEAKTIVEFASRVLSRLGTEDSDNEQQ